MMSFDDEVTKTEIGYFEIGKDRLLVCNTYADQDLDKRKCVKLTLTAVNSDGEEYQSAQALQVSYDLPVALELEFLALVVENRDTYTGCLKLITNQFVAEASVDLIGVSASPLKAHYRVIEAGLPESIKTALEKGSSEGLLTYEYVGEDTLKEDKKKLNRLLSTALDYHTEAVAEKTLKTETQH